MICSNLTIESGQGRYIVERFGDVESLLNTVLAIDDGFIAIDATIVDRYPRIAATIEERPHHCIVATESEKTLFGVERLLLALQAAGGHKRSTIVAIGGGIVQDIASLAAHIWYRGIDVVFVPTTLLAMADSCIGAKSAVNLGMFKNQLGTFQAPRRVLVCLDFISTLAGSDVRSGWGEIVKLAIIDSRAAYALVRDDLDSGAISETDPARPVLARHIDASLKTKRRTIERDEYEKDERRILNFGHTFGHALESVTANAVAHGAAVAWGIDVANYISWRKGFLGEADFVDMHSCIRRHFQLPKDTHLDRRSLIAAMKRDKKAHSTSIALVLAYAPGDVRIVSTTFDSEFDGFIDDYLASAGITFGNATHK